MVLELREVLRVKLRTSQSGACFMTRHIGKSFCSGRPCAVGLEHQALKEIKAATDD
jgi:hypothetical protein